MDKILVPIDFSDTSRNALYYAIKLFGKTDVEITILNTYETPRKTRVLRDMNQLILEDTREEMESFVKKVYEEENHIKINYKIIRGDAVTVISDLGDSGKYDFIVMGTKGASGLKEVFIGSVAGGVISNTSAPVFVVPDNYIYRPLDEIVFAISGMSFSSPSVVEPLRKIAKMRSCDINVLHIADVKTAELEGAISIIEDFNPSVTYVFSAGNINEKLNKYLIKDDAKLLCLVRRKRGFFQRIFGESVTMKQTFNSPIPLLILHN